jgi:hypothetical protein
MKAFVIVLLIGVGLVLCKSSWAQSRWSWKGWNRPTDERTQNAEVEPIEITDDEQPSSAWTNPFANWNLKPKPVEWKTPAFIRRMNENNARMWRKTRRSIGHWASSTGEAIRNSTYDTWEAMSRAAYPEKEPEPAHPSPSFGGVHEFLNRPKLKF